MKVRLLLSMLCSVALVASLPAAEVQTPDGKPIEGFGTQDCVEMIGDRIEHPVRWKRGDEVSALAGKPVRLRFVLKDADLKSLQFTDRQ
jgi:hypothetical protein